MSIEYKAESLAQIAQEFSRCAAQCRNSAAGRSLKKWQADDLSQARTWEAAADFLRKTTLVEGTEP